MAKTSDLLIDAPVIEIINTMRYFQQVFVEQFAKTALGPKGLQQLISLGFTEFTTTTEDSGGSVALLFHKAADLDIAIRPVFSRRTRLVGTIALGYREYGAREYLYDPTEVCVHPISFRRYLSADAPLPQIFVDTIQTWIQRRLCVKPAYVMRGEIRMQRPGE